MGLTGNSPGPWKTKKYNKMGRVWKSAGIVLLVLLFLAALYHANQADSADSDKSRLPRGELIMLTGALEKTAENCYEYRIPDGKKENYIFCMESYVSSLSVELDGTEIHRFEDAYGERGVRKQWVELAGDCSGKKLTLRFRSSESITEIMLNAPMYLGEKNAVFCHFLYSEGYAPVFFCISVVFGLLLFGCVLLLHRKVGRQKTKSLLYLGSFILDAGIWVLLDSQFLQLFTGRMGVVAVFSFTALLLLPTWLILFVRETVIRTKKLFDILCLITLTVTGLTHGAFVFRIQPMHNMIVLQHIMIIITICAVLWVGIREIKKYKNTEMKRILKGFGILSAFIFLSLLSFYRDPSKSYAFLYCIGFLSFTLYLSIASFRLAYREVEAQVSLAAYRRMAYRDSMTGLENRTALEETWESDEVKPGTVYVMLDNNNLKLVNDRFGHKAGDHLLIDTAECLREVFGRIGRCFRIGGDEFLIILKDMEERILCEELLRLDTLIYRKNLKRGVPISIAYGYAICGRDGGTARELFEAADRNMYRNKQKMKQSGLDQDAAAPETSKEGKGSKKEMA